MDKNIKIIACSDIHGDVDFDVDPCDILIIAGDICISNRGADKIIRQEAWLRLCFSEWVKKQPAKEIVAVAGNHDWIWEHNPELVPHIADNFHYLCDEEINLFGLRIYGTPQQKAFNRWAFNRNDDQLRFYYDNIPDDLDILIVHGPPHMIFDGVERFGELEHHGCKILRERLLTMRKPPRFVFSGHFHREYGKKQVEEFPQTTFVSCSLLDENYERLKNPLSMEIAN